MQIKKNLQDSHRDSKTIHNNQKIDEIKLLLVCFTQIFFSTFFAHDSVLFDKYDKTHNSTQLAKIGEHNTIHNT